MTDPARREPAPPVDDARRPNTACVELGFDAAIRQVRSKPRVLLLPARVLVRAVDRAIGDGPVVRCEHNDGVFPLAHTFERLKQTADALIHMARVCGALLEGRILERILIEYLTCVTGKPRLGGFDGDMNGGKRNVAEPRLLPALDPFRGLAHD